MELYFMQHGQAVTEQEDPTRPLSREGVEQIKASASAIQKLGVSFDVIICSPKRRAHQSAALIAEAIRYPYSDIMESDTVLPKAEPAELLQKLDQMIGDKILIVGHLPNLSRLVSALLRCDDELVCFENGGLVVVSRAATGNRLGSVLTAGQMRVLGRK
jgi:phosphohistidine phosphatase